MLRRGILRAALRRHCSSIAHRDASVSASGFKVGMVLEHRTLESWQRVAVVDVMEDGTVYVRDADGTTNFLIPISPERQAEDLRQARSRFEPNTVREFINSLAGLIFWFVGTTFPIWIGVYYSMFDSLTDYYTPYSIQYAEKDPYYYEQEAPGYEPEPTWHPPMLTPHNMR